MSLKQLHQNKSKADATLTVLLTDPAITKAKADLTSATDQWNFAIREACSKAFDLLEAADGKIFIGDYTPPGYMAPIDRCWYEFRNILRYYWPRGYYIDNISFDIVDGGYLRMQWTEEDDDDGSKEDKILHFPLEMIENPTSNAIAAFIAEEQRKIDIWVADKAQKDRDKKIAETIARLNAAKEELIKLGALGTYADPEWDSDSPIQKK